MKRTNLDPNDKGDDYIREVEVEANLRCIHQASD